MTETPPRSWTKRDVGAVALPALAAILVYLPALSLSFTSDDFFILDRIKTLGGLRDPLAYFGRLGFFEYYRPLAFVSHALDWTLWGQRATGFHLTNVLLHAIASLLVAVLGRRLYGSRVALVGGLLFALHPASHEAVYWIAARFDLLATCFMLASLLFLLRDEVAPYWFGVGCFALALLSKESALSLPMIAAAADVIVKKRDWPTTARRLVPLVLVVAVYAVLRAQAVDLDVAASARRLPKLAMIAAMIGGLVLLARLRAGKAPVPIVEERSLVSAIAIGLSIAAAAAALLYLPVSSAWMREKLGFVAFTGFYLASPIVLPQPWPYFLDQTTNVYALAGLVVLAIAVAVVLRVMHWITRDMRVVFLLVFVAAALVPVSSLTSGGRYFYLASVGFSLLVGVASLTLARYTAVVAAIGLVFALSALQLDYAARAWAWASTMTSSAMTLMTSDLAPCGTRDVILLTAPVGIRGTYCNFLWEGFGLTSDCAPKSFRTLLRVVQRDVTVAVSRPAPGVLELRVRNYTGNILASADLSTFEIWIDKGRTTTVMTPLGQLDARPDGDDEVFTLTLDPALAEARLYFYGDGAVKRVVPVQ
jgi:hypothetical protein